MKESKQNSTIMIPEQSNYIITWNKEVLEFLSIMDAIVVFY